MRLAFIVFNFDTKIPNFRLDLQNLKFLKLPISKKILSINMFSF